MQQIVTAPHRPLPRVLEQLLPTRLVEEIHTALPRGLFPEEIRLRRERCASLVVAGENLPLRCVLDGGEMDALLPAFCEGSLYAHGETVCRGFVTLQGGIRVGICGRAIRKCPSDCSWARVRFPPPRQICSSEVRIGSRF